MKTFVLRLIAFIVLYVASVSGVIFVSNYVIIGKHDYHVVPKENIILGNSRPESAFDDAVIAGVYNFSYSAETYYYTYLKLKGVLRENNHIKTVFIQYDYDDISDLRDSWTWGEEHMKRMYPKYSYIMDTEDYGFLLAKNPGTLLSVHFFQTIIRQTRFFTLSKKAKQKFWGGYARLERFKLDSLLKAQDEKAPIQTLKPSKVQVQYLGRIIKLLHDNHVRVFLMRTPVHPATKRERKSADELVRLSGVDPDKVEYLDFSNYPVTNGEFADFTHLNHKGAAELSTFFNDVLKKGLLEKTDAASFLQDEIENRRQERASVTLNADQVR